MAPKRQYSINLSSLLIAVSGVYLLWPGSGWLNLYRLLAVCGLLFMLFSLAFILYGFQHDRLVSKSRLPKQTHAPIASIVNGLMLLLAWLMNDQSVWWLTVALVLAGWVVRLMVRRIKQSMF